jgi:hypothetical protein
MAAALVINGPDPVNGQGSQSTSEAPADVVGSSFVAGVSPANGNYITLKQQMYADTVEGHLLICAIEVITFQSAPYLPIIGPPITPGITWVLAGVIVSDPSSYENSPPNPALTYFVTATAVYFCLNAPELLTSVETQQTTTFSGTYYDPPLIDDSEIIVTLEITEWSGVPATDVATVLTAKGFSDTPDGGLIDVGSNVDVLIVCSSGTGSDVFNGPGTGYTGLDNLAVLGPDGDYDSILFTEYMLNQIAGSYDTDFSGPSDQADPWALVAVAFAASTLSPNFVQNGPPLQIPYELVAYQGATLTGSYAYSCGPPIIRGLYQTPIFTHT